MLLLCPTLHILYVMIEHWRFVAILWLECSRVEDILVMWCFIATDIFSDCNEKMGWSDKVWSCWFSILHWWSCNSIDIFSRCTWCFCITAGCEWWLMDRQLRTERCEQYFSLSWYNLNDSLWYSVFWIQKTCSMKLNKSAEMSQRDDRYITSEDIY